jgi:uncharacterized membrane protein (DUF2068 family)
MESMERIEQIDGSRRRRTATAVPLPITITQSATRALSRESTRARTGVRAERGAREAVYHSTPMRSRDTVLKWIIAFKVVKTASLASLGIALLVTRRRDPTDVLLRTAMMLHLPVTSRLMQRALEVAANLSIHRREALALTAFAYAALLGTEGVGLHYRKPWSRWLTIIATASLVPLEIYECAREPHVVRFVILAINVLVVIYLARRKEIFE